MRDGRVAYVLTAVIRPDALRATLSTQDLPDGAAAKVLDRRYNVVARSLDDSRRVGRPASADLVTLLQRGERAGQATTRTLEGCHVYTVYFRRERATVLPRSAGHVRGVINLRGQVVPVLDVRRRFGLAHRDPDAETVLIVVQVPSTSDTSTTVGLLVDGVSDVVEIDEANVRPAPEVCGAQARDFVRGIAPLDGKMLLLLDLPALVGNVDQLGRDGAGVVAAGARETAAYGS